ncbi:MAG: hypothetical protein IPM43_01820 [Actinomycetota bacterium]|nr:MAG: hypothetical protein IPM43_01820 [Actinomycetota bacterium]
MLLWTTRVDVERPDPGGDDDPYEAQTWSQVVSNCATHIGSPSGRDLQVGGGKEVVDAVLHAPVDVMFAHGDRVTEPASGETWTATWVQRRRGFGLDHQRVGLRRVDGAA